jgi:hypothetical protein
MVLRYSQLLRSTEAQPSSSQDLIVLAIDCSEPEQPRSYTHLRSPHVCFGSCWRDIDPRTYRPDLLTDTARADHKLWRRVLGCDSDVSASALLQSKCHRTGGVCYDADVGLRGGAVDGGVQTCVGAGIRADGAWALCAQSRGEVY